MPKVHSYLSTPVPWVQGPLRCPKPRLGPENSVSAIGSGLDPCAPWMQPRAYSGPAKAGKYTWGGSWDLIITVVIEVTRKSAAPQGPRKAKKPKLVQQATRPPTALAGIPSLPFFPGLLRKSQPALGQGYCPRAPRPTPSSWSDTQSSSRGLVQRAVRGTVASFRALGVLTVMSASFCDWWAQRASRVLSKISLVLGRILRSSRHAEGSRSKCCGWNPLQAGRLRDLLPKQAQNLNLPCTTKSGFIVVTDEPCQVKCFTKNQCQMPTSLQLDSTSRAQAAVAPVVEVSESRCRHWTVCVFSYAAMQKSELNRDVRRVSVLPGSPMDVFCRLGFEHVWVLPAEAVTPLPHKGVMKCVGGIAGLQQGRRMCVCADVLRSLLHLSGWQVDSTAVLQEGLTIVAVYNDYAENCVDAGRTGRHLGARASG